jgi:competence protein ComEC
MKPVQSLILNLQEQRDRWILWMPVPLACGIGAYFYLPAEPPASTGILLLTVLVGCIFPAYRNKTAPLVWLVFFLAALGFSAAQFRTWRVDAPVLHKKIYTPLTMQGRIIDIDALEKSYRVTLDDLSFSGANLPQEKMPLRVRIKLKNSDSAVPRAGDVIEVKVMLQPLPEPVLPGAYDFQQYGYFHRLGATGFALSNIRVVEANKTTYLFEDLRTAIREKINNAHLAEKNIEGLTVAFMIGDSGNISQHDWDVARKSGIAHLIAISGSHFAMIVGVVFFSMRALLAAIPYVALRWPIKKISALAGICAAVFYMLLIGSPIPAQRAVVMSAVVMFAVLLDREPFTLRLAALAAVVVLLLEPESLIGPSFQMSFAAVVGMIAFFESVREWWRDLSGDAGALRKAGLFLLSCLLTTMVATAATAPFALYHFLRVPFLSGLVANMIAVPLSSFVTFPLGLFACLLMPLGLEKIPLWITEKSIEIIMREAEAVASWPHMIFYADAWPVQWLVMIVLGGLWICIWRGHVRWLGIAPILIATLLISVRPRPDILAGGDFRLLAAVRDGAGRLWISPGGRDKFIRNAWSEREGGDGAGVWPEEGNNFISCTARACTYTLKGQIIVFNKQSDFHPKPGEEIDLEAAGQDCRSADLVIMPRAKRPQGFCKAEVIDKWSLYENGAHIVYLKAGTPPLIQTVSDWRGVRPWTGKKKWKKK